MGRVQPHLNRPIKELVIAKFHYTGPTGPARTFLRRNFVGSVRVSDKVRAGPRGSGRARVVEFSYKRARAGRLAFSVGLHARCRVDRVAEQTVARHLAPDDTRAHRTYAPADHTTRCMVSLPEI